MKESDSVLQKVKDERYLVRLGTLRLGEVVYSSGKWYYISNAGSSKAGYETREQATSALVETAMKRLKKPSDYPRLQFRLPQERIDWFREYAQRQGKSMSAIIKDCIEQLYQQSQSAAGEVSVKNTGLGKNSVMM